VTAGLQLGAPGIYPAPAEQPAPDIVSVRLDIAGFAGIAPRGPVDQPVTVTSWSEYVQDFGGFHPPYPGHLAYAVAAFFDQGGQCAHVVRVAGPPDPQAHARHRLDSDTVTTAAGPVELTARDEGTWGDLLRLTLSYDFTSQFTVTPDALSELMLPEAIALPAGSLLRLRGTGLRGAGILRWVTSVVDRAVGPGRRHIAILDEPLPEPTAGTGAQPAPSALTVTVITGHLTVTDEDPTFSRSEEFTQVGLDPSHPRWLAGVLGQEARWVRADGPWTTQRIAPASALLETASSTPVHPGADRYGQITVERFFDPDGQDGDPLDARPHRGVDALLHHADAQIEQTGQAGRPEELGLLAVPDLFWNGMAEPEEHTEPAGRRASADFEPCRPPEPPATYRQGTPRAVPLDGATELDEIVRRQQMLVCRAERFQRFLVLLDVPPGLPTSRVREWRARFDSTYAAAYHPWLGVARTDDDTDTLVQVPPSAFAAGIIAARERRHGLPWGPANELAAGAVSSSDTTTAAQRDTLFALAVNVFAPERDGFRLASARTLSVGPDYRFLSVRRLMVMLRLTLERELQWVVFEPHDEQLRRVLVVTLTTFLRRWFQAGAFAGASEDEAFFVHCDAALNPPPSLAEGRLIAEIGVAPAAPLEFLILQLSLEAGGELRLEDR
jgi:hypothetical protein